MLLVALALSACGRPPDRAAPAPANGDRSRSFRHDERVLEGGHAGAQRPPTSAAWIIWKGPIREDDRDEQIKIVENFTSQGVDGIVLAPLDEEALAQALNDAKARKIPVVIFDSGVKWNDYVSFVATDNYKAGALGAERLGQVLGGKGNVILLRYAEGSASTMEREAGFLDTIGKAFPGITVVSSNRYAGATVEPALAAAENLISTFGTAQGMFTPNESTTLGTLRFARQTLAA